MISWHWGAIWCIVVMILGLDGTGISSSYFGVEATHIPILSHLSDSEISAASGMDDKSIDRVVGILESNIEQWDFIESQLLEPNVNLGMPEVFIPLRHFTTTLELLGTILFMKDEIEEAKSALERACPLLELLPPSSTERGDHQASSCYKLLKKVYSRLHNNVDTDASDGSDDPWRRLDFDSRHKRQMLEGLVGALSNNLDQHGLHQDMSTNILAKQRKNTGTGEGSHEQRKRAHKKRRSTPLNDEWSSDSEVGLESEAGMELSDDGATADGSSADELGNDREWTHPSNITDADETVSECVEESVGSEDCPRVPAKDDEFGDFFDIGRRLEELRYPFDHLRGPTGHASEVDIDAITGRTRNGVQDIADPTTDDDTGNDNDGPMETHDDKNDEKMTEKMTEKDLTNPDDGADAGTEAVFAPIAPGDFSDVIRGPSAKAVDNLIATIKRTQEAEIDRAQSSSAEKFPWAQAGLSEKMWTMMLKYAAEDDAGRRDVLHQARQDYADLHVSVEEFDSPEVATKLALADAYLAVMHKATHDGFAFIKRELREYWGPKVDSKSSTGFDFNEDFMSTFGELSPSEKARIMVLTAFERAISRQPKQRKAPGKQEPMMEETGPHMEKSSSADKKSTSKRQTRANTQYKKQEWEQRKEKRTRSKKVVITGNSNTKLWSILVASLCFGMYLAISVVKLQQQRIEKGKSVPTLMKCLKDVLHADYSWSSECIETAWQWLLLRAYEVEYVKPIMDSAGLHPKPVHDATPKVSGSGSNKHTTSSKSKSSGKVKTGSAKTRVKSSNVTTDVPQIPLTTDSVPVYNSSDDGGAGTVDDDDDDNDDDDGDDEDGVDYLANIGRPSGFDQQESNKVMLHVPLLNETSPRSAGGADFTLVSKERTKLDRQRLEAQIQADLEREREKAAKERKEKEKERKEKEKEKEKQKQKEKEKEKEKNKQKQKEKEKEKNKEKGSAEPKKLSKKDSPRDGHAEKKGPSPPTSAKLTGNSTSHPPNEERERREEAAKGSKVSKGATEDKSIALVQAPGKRRPSYASDSSTASATEANSTKVEFSDLPLTPRSFLEDVPDNSAPPPAMQSDSIFGGIIGNFASTSTPELMSSFSNPPGLSPLSENTFGGSESFASWGGLEPDLLSSTGANTMSFGGLGVSSSQTSGSVGSGIDRDRESDGLFSDALPSFGDAFKLDNPISGVFDDWVGLSSETDRMDNLANIPLSSPENLSSTFDDALLPTNTRGPPAQPYGSGNNTMGTAPTPSDGLSDGLSFSHPAIFGSGGRSGSGNSDSDYGIENANLFDFGVNTGGSSLSPEAQSFSPGTSLPASDPMGRITGPSKPQTIAIVLTCSVRHLSPSSVSKVQVNIPFTDAYGIKKFESFYMRRSASDPYLWGAKVDVPRPAAHFEYTYVIINSMNMSFREGRSIRRLSLDIVGATQDKIELDDKFDPGTHVMNRMVNA